MILLKHFDYPCLYRKQVFNCDGELKLSMMINNVWWTCLVPLTKKDTCGWWRDEERMRSQIDENFFKIKNPIIVSMDFFFLKRINSNRQQPNCLKMMIDVARFAHASANIGEFKWGWSCYECSLQFLHQLYPDILVRPGWVRTLKVWTQCLQK